MDKHKEIELRPYTHKDLAGFYKVSWVTFQEWLKPFMEEIGPKKGHFYNLRQVKIIFERLGWPSVND
jgi:hypothetical protein